MSPEIPVVVDVKTNELVIVPASLELITTDGVVSFDGVLTTVSSLSVGAAVSESILSLSQSRIPLVLLAPDLLSPSEKEIEEPGIFKPKEVLFA